MKIEYTVGRDLDRDIIITHYLEEMPRDKVVERLRKRITPEQRSAARKLLKQM